MTINFFGEYMTPVIVGICLCVGYIIKNCITTDKINKFIPLMMGLLGLFLALWMADWYISPNSVLSGLFSGLASTGMYELFRNIINKGDVINNDI